MITIQADDSALCALLLEVLKGGPGSGHHGHGGRPGQVGGSVPGTGIGVAARRMATETTVGITSAREGKQRERVEHEMHMFSSAMAHIDDVSDLDISIGEGGWQESPGKFIHEPTWVTSYRGNGEALKLIKKVASEYEQDAVLLQVAGGDSPQSNVVFDGDVTDGVRDVIQRSLSDGGIGGWTWGITESGNTMLQTTSVPEWGGDAGAHVAVVDDLVGSLKAAGIRTSYTTEYVDVMVLEKGRDYE